ncbi:MAG: hypothetical protein Q8P12_04565, partial [bacterium]|nr:hypothetical protein [bacterium]
DTNAERLATLTLNGGHVRKTARDLKISPSTVTRTRQKAESGVNSLSDVVQQQKKREYAEIWGNAEELAVEKGITLVAKAKTARNLPAVATFAGIAADKRYREEHPESVRGNVVNIDNRSVHLHADEAIAAILEARKQLREPRTEVLDEPKDAII